MENKKAYLFDTEDIQGNKIRLEDYKGKKLMVSFFRYASCPFCNLRVQELITRYASLKDQGLNIIVFFESNKESIMKYSGKRQVPFPIIADPDRIIYGKYGVTNSSVWGMIRGLTFRMPTMIRAMRNGHSPGKMEGDKYLLPADFLIGPDLLIENAHFGKDIGDHFSIKEVENWINKG